MFVCSPTKSIFEVARAIMRESPATDPKMALLLARYIYQNRERYLAKAAENTNLGK